jgi:hypothetical protein
MRITLSASNRGGSRAVLDDGTVLCDATPRPVVDAARRLHADGMRHDTPLEFRWNGQDKPFKVSTLGQCFRLVNNHNQEKIAAHGQAVQFWQAATPAAARRAAAARPSSEAPRYEGDASSDRSRGKAHRAERWYPR